jgi:myo-inositol 2-dehydrogenase / D-chiro-inositol 1-dehydrogenase
MAGDKHDRYAGVDRRAFMASVGAAGLAIATPAVARTYQANEKLAVGLIGCGGRGNWIAKLFQDAGMYEWVACADYYQDRVDATGDQLKIDASRRFSGLSGYKRLLDTPLDAVVIETPPYFHPSHAAAAVDAGKHVFLAKPIAVDVPGCLSVGESAKRATENKLVFRVDFQTRANELYREAVRRVRGGDIGKLVLGEAHYPWSGGSRDPAPTVLEEQLRNWYHVLALSGDFVVEQAIHALDVASWIADAEPLRAWGTGGRSLRAENTIWDHFAVNYEYPNGFVLSFSAIQTIPGVKDEIRCRVFGADGVIDTDYFGDVWIKGKKPYEGGSTGSLYTTGAVTNIVEFHQAVKGGQYANETAPASVRSNLLAVMARMAGYSHGELTWKELLSSTDRLEPNLKGLKA